MNPAFKEITSLDFEHSESYDAPVFEIINIGSAATSHTLNADSDGDEFFTTSLTSSNVTEAKDTRSSLCSLSKVIETLSSAEAGSKLAVKLHQLNANISMSTSKEPARRATQIKYLELSI